MALNATPSASTDNTPLLSGGATAGGALYQSPGGSPPSSAGSGISISFKDVAVVHRPWYEVGRRHRVVVQAASGLFDSGGVHAIVATDAVSSRELVSTLAGIKIPAQGTVMANGVPVIASSFRQSVGYVTASNCAFLDLNAMQNVKFALDMRTTRAGPATSQLVDNALSVAGLCGRERLCLSDLLLQRRVNIAMELASDPAVLFAVEIMQGLSYSECNVLMTLLQNISQNGKTIVLTIDALPLHVFQRLTSLIILGRDGQTLFSGRRELCCAYFSSLQLPLWSLSTTTPNTPRGSAAVSIANSPASPWQQQLVQPEEGGDPFLVFDSAETVMDVVHVWAEDSDTTTRFAASFYDSECRAMLFNDERVALLPSASVNRVSSRHYKLLKSSADLSTPSQVARVITLIKYTVTCALRQQDFYVSLGAMLSVVGLCCWFVSEQASDQSGMMNVRGIMFFLFFLIVTLNDANVSRWDLESRAFVQQRDGDYYSAAAFLVVLLLRLALSRIVMLGAMTAIIYTLLNSHDANELLALLGVTSFVHALVAYLVVLLVQNPGFSMLLLTLYSAYMAMFSGFLINVGTLPPIASRVSLLRYGYGAAVSLVLKDKPRSCDAGNITCYTGKQYLELQGFQDDSTMNTIAMLLYIAAAALPLLLLRMNWMQR